MGLDGEVEMLIGEDVRPIPRPDLDLFRLKFVLCLYGVGLGVFGGGVDGEGIWLGLIQDLDFCEGEISGSWMAH